MSARLMFTILSALCILGAIVLSALGRDSATVAALLGLAGTLAGRGTA